MAGASPGSTGPIASSSLDSATSGCSRSRWRARRAEDVIAVGKYPLRQELARAYGAAVVLEPDDPRLVARIHERTGGLGAALVFEAAGTATSLLTAVDAARKGGTVVLLGVHHEPVALDWRRVLMNEQRIIGSIIYRRDDFADAIGILASGTIDLDRHVTGTIPLADIVPRGFVDLIDRRSQHVKIQVRPG